MKYKYVSCYTIVEIEYTEADNPQEAMEIFSHDEAMKKERFPDIISGDMYVDENGEWKKVHKKEYII